MMDYVKRYDELKSVFRLGSPCHLEESGTDIRFCSFLSRRPNALQSADENPAGDEIPENGTFIYPVFVPSEAKIFDKALLLLHGLNERSWNKYLAWAEYLCVETRRPVILFPIAYHMNRSPWWWANPRKLLDALNLRRSSFADDTTISFANVALSKRLSDNPSQFYLSGRQTFADLTMLAEQIKSGRNPLFKENAGIDIFSYSIGSFLSQILLMANPQNLFSESKLFMFCGGSIFSAMDGISKSIMDKEAFEKIRAYYIHTFGRETSSPWLHDRAFDSFESMISPERKQDERLSFFKNIGKRIRGISLEKDTVIPYQGVEKALGEDCTKSNVQLLDFPTSYSHENPFPIQGTSNPLLVNHSFLSVFETAAGFLAG